MFKNEIKKINDKLEVSEIAYKNRWIVSMYKDGELVWFMEGHPLLVMYNEAKKKAKEL